MILNGVYHNSTIIITISTSNGDCQQVTLSLILHLSEIPLLLPYFFINNDMQININRKINHGNMCTDIIRYIIQPIEAKWCRFAYISETNFASDNPNQCWFVINWTLSNKLQWNLHQNTTIGITENEFNNAFFNVTPALIGWVRIHPG